MFQWLSELLFGPDPLTIINNALAESHRQRLREEEAYRKQQEGDPRQVRRRKKEQLEEELEDARWVLEYERKLTRLQEQVEDEINRTGDRGRSPKRLQNLQSHLRDVRRSITHE